MKKKKFTEKQKAIIARFLQERHYDLKEYKAIGTKHYNNDEDVEKILGAIYMLNEYLWMWEH
jgi:transposase